MEDALASFKDLGEHPDHSGAGPWRYDHDLRAWNWSPRENVEKRPWKYLLGEIQRLSSKETACRVSYCLKIHCTLQSSFSHFFLYKRGRCSFSLFRFLVSICDIYFLLLLESGYSISLIILLDSNLHTHSIDWFDYLLFSVSKQFFPWAKFLQYAFRFIHSRCITAFGEGKGFPDLCC